MDKEQRAEQPSLKVRPSLKAKQTLSGDPQASLPTGSVGNDLHGGDIFGASAAYGRPVSEWLDLSTGMNPNPWRVPALPQSAFEYLPYEDPAFTQAAADYYGVNEVNGVKATAVAGSQMAIECLPSLLPNLPVLLPSVGYQEHRVSWTANGNELLYYPSMQSTEAALVIDRALARNAAQHLLVINPNNPTGIVFGVEQLLAWAMRLRGGACLMVDEAFIDLDPAQSVLTQCQEGWPDNIIVLRSFGKFFGLAGIRLGFVFASPSIGQSLQARLGLWAVNAPAQKVALRAFADVEWQRLQREQLPRAAQCQRDLFTPLLSLQAWGVSVCPQAEQPLFSSYQMPTDFALALQDFFATQAILVRVVRVDEQSSLLRVGLMANCVQQQTRVRDTLAAFIEAQRKPAPSSS